jgi:hypothetical protein
MVAGMPSARASILHQLSTWPTSADAVRPVPEWSGHPVLGRLPDGAMAVAAAHQEAEVFEALASRPADPVATAAAMAVLAAQLLPIVSSWMRRGLAGDDLADAEADLIVETIAAMRQNPTLCAAAITQAAWHRVATIRHTAARRAARSTRFSPRHDRAVDEEYGRVDTSRLLQEALAAGILTSSIATAIATVAAVRSPAGPADICSPGARRKRLLRARRALRTLLAADGSL